MLCFSELEHNNVSSRLHALHRAFMDNKNTRVSVLYEGDLILRFRYNPYCNRWCANTSLLSSETVQTAPQKTQILGGFTEDQC